MDGRDYSTVLARGMIRMADCVMCPWRGKRANKIDGDMNITATE